MQSTIRRITRLLLLVLATAVLGACHFHGCGHWARHCGVSVSYCR